jgi:hypothetical protein
MLRIADFDFRRAADSRARIDEIGRIEHAGAVLALIPARLLIAAMRAGTNHVSVGKEAVLCPAVDLLRHSLFDEPHLPQRLREILS